MTSEIKRFYQTKITLLCNVVDDPDVVLDESACVLIPVFRPTGLRTEDSHAATGGGVRFRVSLRHLLEYFPTASVRPKTRTPVYCCIFV